MTPPLRFSVQSAVAARSLLGLPDLPTVVVLGPFDDLSHAEQLAAAFTAVRRRCNAQFVLLGTGVQRTAIIRRAFAQGVRASVHTLGDSSGRTRSEVVAAADLVVLSPDSGPQTLLEVLGAGRAVVAPADAATVRLVVPASAGLVYRPGDASGLAGALLRLLTKPSLRHGMACRAGEVARRHHLRRIRLQQFDEREQSCIASSDE